MKIRTDFVSNSSSSSFFLVGAVIDIDQLKAVHKRLFPDKDLDEEDYCEMADAVANATGLQAEQGISEYYDDYVIGLGFDAMKDDETKRDFVARIKKALKGLGIEEPVKPRLDAGYDS